MSRAASILILGFCALSTLVSSSLADGICEAVNNCTALVKAGGCDLDAAFVNKRCPGICDKCKTEDYAPTRGRAAAPMPKHEYDCENEGNTPCEEYFEELELHKENGCGTNKLMLKLCRQTCGLCNYEHLCLDQNPKLCTELAASGTCSSNYTYMVNLCPVTCGKCGAGGFCLDNAKSCANALEDGKCDKDSTMMYETCPLSCGKCAADNLCLDKNKRCAEYALAGQCESNATFMMENCPVSCGECPDVCQDRLKTCAKLSAAGDCTKKEAFMTENCPASCDKCVEVYIEKLQKDVAFLNKEVAELERTAITGIRLDFGYEANVYNGPGVKDHDGWIVTGLHNWNRDEYSDSLTTRRLDYRVNGTWIQVGPKYN